MTVCVVGLGYIGLPTALLLAREREVVGVDIDPDRVATLREGELPFEEPGMEELFASVRNSFTARTTMPEDESGVSRSSAVDTYLIATPTPLDEVTQVPNLEYLRTAVESVGSAMTPGDTVVLESTVPPGTTKRLVLPIIEESNAGPNSFSYAYCPERALPGNTVHEMVHNDRVIGGLDDESRERAADLYGFVEGSIYMTDPMTAEFTKLIENTYRDVNIALANEFGKLAEQFGIDGRAAIELANNHPRVDILSPGPGVGGHCLPIDPQFLIQISENSRLISVAREINNTMPVHVLRLLRELVGSRADASITVLGVAYKGGVNDTRGTPAWRFLRLAENEGYEVRVHDPHVETFEYALHEMEAAVDGSDCLVLVTDHPEYEDLEPKSLAPLMRESNLLDTRGILDRDRWEAAGFNVQQLADGR